MKQALEYSVKVWLTTSILASSLLTSVHIYFQSVNGLNPLHDPKMYDKNLHRFIWMIGGNIIFLLPLGFALFFGTRLLIRRAIQTVYIKCWLSIIGVVLVTLPENLVILSVLSSNTESSFRTLTVELSVQSMICGIVGVLGCIWFYTIKPFAQGAHSNV